MNERIAIETKGRLLLRIEDLDRTRCKPQFEAAIGVDLKWLGVQFAGVARRQSEHPGEYDAALGRLAAQGLAYPCFCSRAEVAAMAVGLDPDGAPLYSGHCRSLRPAERAKRIERGDRMAWRLDATKAAERVGERLHWSEYREGREPVECPVEPALWGDVVLRGRDLAASYHLAVTVDDALQGVTDVVRGRDLLAATSVHRLLQGLLGLPAPRYRHHRLVLDPTGSKLAKRRDSPSLAALRETGAFPDQVRAALGFQSGDRGGISVRLS